MAEKKVLGVLGGMGIDVTAEFLRRLVDVTSRRKATPREQEHLRVIVDHNPGIPDRTEAILGKGPSPLPDIVSSLGLLEKAGAGLIAVPCNTAHFWYPQMRRAVGVPVINMIEAVARRCLASGARCAGLLATSGTVGSGIYQRVFEALGIGLLAPPAADQDRVLSLIMSLKAREDPNPTRESFLALGRDLAGRGSDVVIVGCTDISLVLGSGDLEVPVVDSLSVLAEASVEAALDLPGAA